MKPRIILMFLIVSILSFATCIAIGSNDEVKGSGNYKTETRNVKNFKGVENHSSADILIKKGDAFEVKIEADDNILPLVITEVKGDVLSISLKPNTSFKKIKVKAYVTMPEINKLEIHGSGNIETSDNFKGDDLKAGINGSGNISANFDGKKVTLSINGSGNINVSGNNQEVKAGVHGSGNITAKGSAETVNIDVYGSGNVDAFDLNVKTVSADIMGSGNCSVNVSEKINADIQGSGNVFYKGSVTDIRTNKQGSGNVIKKD